MLRSGFDPRARRKMAASDSHDAWTRHGALRQLHAPVPLPLRPRGDPVARGEAQLPPLDARCRCGGRSPSSSPTSSASLSPSPRTRGLRSRPQRSCVRTVTNWDTSEALARPCSSSWTGVAGRSLHPPPNRPSRCAATSAAARAGCTTRTAGGAMNNYDRQRRSPSALSGRRRRAWRIRAWAWYMRARVVQIQDATTIIPIELVPSSATSEAAPSLGCTTSSSSRAWRGRRCTSTTTGSRGPSRAAVGIRGRVVGHVRGMTEAAKNEPSIETRAARDKIERRRRAHAKTPKSQKSRTCRS